MSGASIWNPSGFLSAYERFLRVPLGESIEDIPAAVLRANKLLGFDALGRPIAVTSGGGGPSTLEGWTSAFDYMTEAQIASVQARDLVEDVTVALQTAIDDTSSSFQSGCKRLYLPAGRYKISATLLLNEQYVIIAGAGMYATEITLSGAHSGFSTANMAYLRPYITDLAINGGGSSDYGLYFGNISNQVYLGALERLLIYTGNTCIYARGNGTNSNYFSMHMQDVSCYSVSGHSFHIRSGPGNTYQKLYALRCGPGKAGYRMGGMVHLDGCNGLNEGDFWGVFGNDPTATDGFQGDFDGNDYIDLTLTNCNVEEWASLSNVGSGIVFHNGIRSFVMNGGKFDRSRPALVAAIPQCHSIVRCRRGPNVPGQAINLRPGSVFLGGTTFTGAALFSDTGGIFTDDIGSFNVIGITTFTQSGLAYPLPYKNMSNDKFQNYSYFQSSFEARHLVVNELRYKELNSTTTGSNLTVDVTGYSRTKLSQASASSVNRFTFGITPGIIAQDYLRNGELVVEAVNANVTLNHNQSGHGKLILAANVSRTLLPGEIIRFIWRESDQAWVEPAGSSIPLSFSNAALGSFINETPASVASVVLPAGGSYAQRVGNMVTAIAVFDFQAQGTPGASASWSVQAPIAPGWDAAWTDVCAGVWAAQDDSIRGHVIKQVGTTNRLLFTCITNAAVIAAAKTCRLTYSYLAV